MKKRLGKKGGQKKHAKLFFGFTYLMIMYIIMLTYAYAHVAFLKARTGQDIFNVAKLGWRNQTDHQLVQDGVHVGGLQMRCSYRGSPTFIHCKDAS